MNDIILDSLKNRRVLLEAEISHQKTLCAKLYWDQVIFDAPHDMVLEYEQELYTLGTLGEELDQVNNFIRNN